MIKSQIDFEAAANGQAVRLASPKAANQQIASVGCALGCCWAGAGVVSSGASVDRGLHGATRAHEAGSVPGLCHEQLPSPGVQPASNSSSTWHGTLIPREGEEENSKIILIMEDSDSKTFASAWKAGQILTVLHSLSDCPATLPL